jgi:hypothetical protein
VPKCFLLLAGCFAFLQIVGILLLFNKNKADDQTNSTTVNGTIEDPASEESEHISNDNLLPSENTEKNSLGVEYAIRSFVFFFFNYFYFNCIEAIYI